MNNVLNATGWGELPTAELEIPDFMHGSYYDETCWDKHYNEARLGEAIGRERKKYRAFLKSKRTIRNGAVVMICTVLMLMIIGTIAG